MLCIVLRSWLILCPVIPIITQWGKHYYHTHFIDEGNWGTQRSHDLPGERVAERGHEPGPSGCKTCFTSLPFRTEAGIEASSIWLGSSFYVPTSSSSSFPLLNIYSDTCWSFLPITYSETHWRLHTRLCCLSTHWSGAWRKSLEDTW